VAVNCVRPLSHIAFALNEQARATFLDLLPASLAEAIAVPRDGEDLDAWECKLLSVFAVFPPLESLPDEGVHIDDEGDEIAEDSAPPSQAVSALASLLLATATSPQRAAPLLFNLPLQLQAPTLHRLLTLSPLSCTRGLSEIEREFVEEVRRQKDASEHWGLETARVVLRAAPSPRPMQRLLQSLSEIDREPAMLLQQHLYEFIDLLQLSERDVQVLLANESNETLARALCDLSESEQKRFLRHVSKRRYAVIREEMERYALITPIEIEETRRAILSTARFLYNTRRITTYFASLDEGENGLQEEDVTELEGEEGENTEKKRKKSRAKKERAHPAARRKKMLLGTGAIAALLLWYLVLLSDDGAEREPHAESSLAKESKGGKGTAIARAIEGIEQAGQRVLAEPSAQAFTGEEQFVDDAAVQAIVDVPGLAQLEIDESADFVQIDGEDGEAGHILELRVGRLRATVVDGAFELHTPLVRIKGPVGAAYSTRVVLDATTAVSIEAKWVEVYSQIKAGKKWRLQRGDRGVFTGDGEAEIVRKEG
jgi:type II secretory pathway component PulM